MRTFVFQDGGSHKFWNIELTGGTYTVTFGKVGTKGQTKAKALADATAAKVAHDKLVAEKLAKGYVETTAPAAGPSAPRAPHPLQAPLEAALVENSDEATAHAAYADYLVEEGDPRGDFMQVQLALEEEGRSPAERKKLQAREKELLGAHAREWLGDLGRFFVGAWSGEDKPYHYAFRRGWLDYVRTLPVPEAVADVLAEAPEARLLRRLDIVYDMRYHPFDFDEFTAGPQAALREGESDGEVYDGTSPLPELLKSQHLKNLRVFKLGFSDDHAGPLAHSTMVDPFGDVPAQEVFDLLANNPRLDELYLNTRVSAVDELFASPVLAQVRVLQYYFGTEYGSDGDNHWVGYPLSALAQNPAAANLTTLRFHPGRETTLDLDEVTALLESTHLPKLEHLQLHMSTFGDDVCEPLIASGVMKRLRTLDLGYGNMTDAGARLLAASADAKRLEVLNLSRNALTGAGVAALKKAGVRVVADGQHPADEQDYLYEVDRE